MNQLDDHTREALCAADQPPPGVEDRILGAILGPIGAGPPDGGGSGGAGATGGGGQWTLAYAAKVVGATLGLTAGGVVLVAITAAGIREGRAPDPGSVPQAVAIEAPANTEPRTSDAPEPAHEPEAGLDPHDSDDPDQAVASAPAPASKPAVAGRASAKLDPQQTPTIEAELALMQVARASSDPKQALATLEQHRREFAAGVFAAEREVLRVEQLCALGRVAQAEAVAASFIATYPEHPLRSRLEASCR